MVTEQSRHLQLIAIPSSDESARGPVLEQPVETLVLRRPELAPVLSRAVSAVRAEFGLGAQVPPYLLQELQQAAASAVADAYEPIAETASRLRATAVESQTAQAASVRTKADHCAMVVSQTATALQQRHDALEESMALEAAHTARAAAASSVPGHKLAARRQAAQEAAEVRAVATARADQRAAAATLTAAVARQAAVRLASETERAAVIVERDTLRAAGALQAAALDMAYDTAVDAACRHLESSATQVPVDRRPPGVVALGMCPELTTVLTEAVDHVLKTSNLTREGRADLAAHVERAAAAAALGCYQRMQVVAVRVSADAAADRRTRTDLVAANAGVIAERVAGTAVAVHEVEAASAHDLVLVATSAAADLAARVGVDDEVAASVAAAVVVKAIAEAAAVDVTAQAGAASGVARAAAAAAAEVAAQAASIAWAAEGKVAIEATDRRRDALVTCYEVAVAAAAGVLGHHPGMIYSGSVSRVELLGEPA